MHRHDRGGQWAWRLVALTLLSFFLVCGNTGLLASEALAGGTPGATEPPERGEATISFQVGVCPLNVTSFDGVPQVDGLPDCTGTGLAGGEEPLAGGGVSLTALEDGDSYSVGLDGSGSGWVQVNGNRTYVATYYGADGVLVSRSVCGSPMSGLAGASESGVYVAIGEEMSCTAIVISPDAEAEPALVGGAIEITLGSCTSGMEPAAFHFGDGGLDCNGDPTVTEAKPFPGVVLTFTNLDTGETWTATTDGGGNGASGQVTEGSYVVSASYNGIALAWTSMCGGTDASGSPLGMLGTIEDSGEPVLVNGGITVQCFALAVQPNGAKNTGNDDLTIVDVTLKVRECPDDFDLARIAMAGTPSAKTIHAVDAQFSTACTQPAALPVDEAGTLTETADGYATKASPGEKLVFGTVDPTLDFWTSCTPEGVSERKGEAVGVSPRTTFTLHIPTMVPAKPVVCTVYLVRAAATVTSVIHVCADRSIDLEAVRCDEVSGGDLTKVTGGISVDLPQATSNYGSSDRVYAGQRWYTRAGFNRLWTEGRTDEGLTTLSAPMPAGTLHLGLGNVTYKGAVTVVCVRPDGTSTTVTLQPDPAKAGQFLPAPIEVGKDGQAFAVTCNWFFEQSKLDS